LDVSVVGLVFASMMMFMGLAAINSQVSLLFGVFGLMIGVFLVSGVISKALLRKLEMRRLLPDHAIAGRPVTISYALSNHKRVFPMLSLSIAELDAAEAFTRQPQAYVLHAAPRMTAVVPVELVPKRRGLHELGLYQLSTSFPFGFIKRAVTLRLNDSLLVFPPIGELDPRVLALFRSAESSGTASRPTAGGQDEFFGTREYRPGDPPRMIHWRGSARAASRGGNLVTKEMTHVSPPKLMVVVDNRRRDGSREAAADAERAVAVAASLIDGAIRRELRAGVTAFNGEAGVAVVPPNRGKRHRKDALTLLAQLPANEGADAAALLKAAAPGRRADVTLVLVTPGHAPPTPQGKHGPVIIACGKSAKHVRFDDHVNFETAMPMGQEPGE
jgi:uncharacterized protein (DUF58 family)